MNQKVRIRAKVCRHHIFNRKGVDCTMCSKYPCFKGIDLMSSNLAVTCHKFKKI